MIAPKINEKDIKRILGTICSLPQENWKKILPHIKTAGENKCVEIAKIGSSFEFWKDMGVFVECEPPLLENGWAKLTKFGETLFATLYIRCDGEEKNILHHLLLIFPPTIAIQQHLWGVAKINTEQVLTILKVSGFWFYDSCEPLTHFLDLLNYVEIISYQKKIKQLKILVSPDVPCVPKNVFVDPSRPFSNIVWIKRILNECEGFIYWLDKHFQKEALEWLWSIADANKITEIKILSLDLGENNLNNNARKEYRRFKQEMNNKGIMVVWSVVDNKTVKDLHDRLIIGQNKYLRNVPNVNAISSGQVSEMNYSDNYEEALATFNGYWLKGQEV